ncbi:Predicted NAD/FAD-binding protein [Chromohalobacter canadensis]|uniref:Predicted NAD/FAD-binding protein n=1 Tax=Chromohalobacter canadensis TaxID=141389 RepID=A0A285VX90_9GAMM|nr:FAD-dependent oxidoreductase [Chromohalobacter canadensis]SOC57866.1 Predicted NAD/FAD-binding protein [Chromohalobacter canadensis]
MNVPASRIAVVGGGIAGMACAHYLSQRHEVTLFEANEHLGGHTATVDVELEGYRYAIDTGFIVFNDRTYPHFQRLLAQLGVTAQATEMSFSVHATHEDFEYNGHTLDTLFAQRRNLLRPGFHKMLRDILRFNRHAVRDLSHGNLPEGMTLGEYLARGGYGESFRRRYLLPMGAAIWSASERDMANFPLTSFVRFFHHHGLLSVNNRPQWYTLVGGARRYIAPLTAAYAQRVRLACPVRSIDRDATGVTLTTPQGRERFDQVVLACHSDQALAMLSAPSQAERQILDALPYQENDVVLHTDTSLLPRRRRAWASWNYRIDGREDDARVSVTYDMNRLQHLPGATRFCVTLNDSDAIAPECMLRRFVYRHPCFTLTGAAAQQRHAEISGPHQRTHFCGAYWRHGFHEDGVWSALRVARALGCDESGALQASLSPATAVPEGALA